ncbi:MAG: amino acid adenylation domain-containing protein [Verrucomicrobiota bacterium]
MAKSLVPGPPSVEVGFRSVLSGPRCPESGDSLPLKILKPLNTERSSPGEWIRHDLSIDPGNTWENLNPQFRLAWAILLQRYGIRGEVVFEGIVRRGPDVERWQFRHQANSETTVGQALEKMGKESASANVETNLHPDESRDRELFASDEAPVIQWTHSDDRVECFLYHHPGSLPEWLGHQMLRQTLHLVSQLCEDEADARKIDDLDPLESSDRQHLIENLNRTEQPFPNYQSYIAAFTDGLEKHPCRPAVCSRGETLTYRQLDEQSNRLAHFLQASGIQRGEAVGVMQNRSLDLAISILSILKAGAVYLPLDPSYPEDRLEYILEDAGVRFALTDRSNRNNQSVDWLFWDSFRSDLKHLPSILPEQVTSPEDIAYLIYTSGSTGRPKGVQIHHGALLNHNSWARHYFGLTAEDRVLQFASINFDISIEEIFPTWISGACLVFRPDEIGSIPRFLDWVESEEITVFNLPTAFWHEVTSALTVRPLPDTVRLAVYGGEKGSRQAVDQWLENTASHVRLVDGYGPTETTVSATTFEITRETKGMSIGRPISNLSAYVLDEHRRPVPLGVQGELWIGGPGVASGYLNRPELTAERFIPDPFSGKPGARLYKTGDLVAYRSDGNLEFAGRADDQVKIRGFRIELGEIQAAIENHPAVLQAAVRLLDHPNGKCLIGYAITIENLQIAENSLEEFLSASIPHYMVPSRIHLLESFPITPGGKIDFKALPGLSASSEVTAHAGEKPRTGTEEKLAEIWKKLLKKDHISREDDFFKLGGDSLAAMRMLGELEMAFERISLPLATLADQPVLRHLGRLIDKGPERVHDSLPPHVSVLRNGNPHKPFVMIHGGGGGILFFDPVSKNIESDHHVIAVESPTLTGNGPVDLENSLVAVAERYYNDLSPILEGRKEAVIAGYSFGGLVAYQIACLMEAEGRRPEKLILFDTFNPQGQAIPLDLEMRIRTFMAKADPDSPAELASVVARRVKEAVAVNCQLKGASLVQAWKQFRGEPLIGEWRSTAIFNHYVTIEDRYHPPVYNGDLNLFTASNEDDKFKFPKDLGWADRVNGKIHLTETPGSHLSIFSEENVDFISENLNQCLRS